MSQIVQTDRAPAAIGPYSQAVRSGSTVYFSGQIPLVPATTRHRDDALERPFFDQRMAQHPRIAVQFRP